jgi:hypothetical protein
VVAYVTADFIGKSFLENKRENRDSLIDILPGDISRGWAISTPPTIWKWKEEDSTRW